jgi:hypothetical protein
MNSTRHEPSESRNAKLVLRCSEEPHRLVGKVLRQAAIISAHDSPNVELNRSCAALLAQRPATKGLQAGAALGLYREATTVARRMPPDDSSNV